MTQNRSNFGVPRALPVLGLAVIAAFAGGCSSHANGSAPSTADDGGVVCTGSAPSGDNVYFVAPDGSDANPGTLAAPWETIAHAQLMVQALPKNAPITIVLRGGTYYQPKTLSFTSVDSGAQAGQISWQAYPCETPIVNGGERLTGWSNVSGNLWQAPLPASSTPFETLYYNGARRMRPRIGASSSAGNLGTFLRVGSEVYSPTSTPECPVQTPQGYKCYDRFKFDPADADKISDKWKNLYNACDGSTSGNAALAGDIEIDLFEAWTMEQMRVKCIDMSSSTITFTSKTPSNATLIPFRGPAKGHRYMIENVADLLTQPMQWFLDRSTSPPTINYLAAPNENPNTDVVVAPQVNPILSGAGLSWVTFSGITFEMDNYVPGPDGFNNDENGESTLPAAVDCESCQNVTFDGLTVRHTSASGLQIATTPSSSTPASNDTVQNSVFYDIGDSGIHIGHTPTAQDKDAEVVQSITIQNNLVQGYSRVFADGEGIAQGNGHDITYTHNDITDGYHAGISVCLLGCPSAEHGDFNITSSYNHIWNAMQGLTADGGTLYYNLGGTTRTATGGKIIHNLLHDVSDSSKMDIVNGTGVPGSAYGGDGIYLDAQTGGVDVEDNVVYRVSEFAFSETEGPAPGQPANTVKNNVFAYARHGMFFEQAPWPQTPTEACSVYASQPLRVSVSSNVFYFDRTATTDSASFYVTQGCAFSCGFTPYSSGQAFTNNIYWRTDGALSTDSQQFHVNTKACSNGSSASGWTFMPFASWQGSAMVGGASMAVNEDEGSVIADPKFTDPSKDDYSLTAAPVAGFDPAQTNDTLLHAGRTAPEIQVAAVPQTFPTDHYATSDF